MSEEASPPTSQSFNRAKLHPGAARAIDRDAVALMAARQLGTIKRGQPDFPSRRIVDGHLTDADLAGEPLLAWSDLAGRTVGRYFPMDGKLVALREAGYLQLRRLVEKILTTKPFNTGLSDGFIEIEVFKWWRACVRGEPVGSLSSRLLDVCEAAVRQHCLLVPLANLEIERAFRLGSVLVTPIDATLFERFETEVSARFPEQAEGIREEARRMSKNLGHLTGVQVDIIGEPEYARQRAREIAFDVADILRFMSPASGSWNVSFACLPYGCEHAPATTVMELNGDRLGIISTGMLDSGHFRWKLSAKELDELMTLGFQNSASFFEAEPLNGFQRRLKTAISAFSQGIASNELRHRVMYAMSAGEHLLLRDENEPIQSSVGERMAFLIAGEPDARRAVVANFKKAYGLRSRQVHHLASIDDEEVLDIFFENMYLMLTAALETAPRYGDHAAFLDAIDRVKFG